MLANLAPAVKYYGRYLINQRASVCRAAVNTLLSWMCALAYASIKETDGRENKKVEEGNLSRPIFWLFISKTLHALTL